MVADATVGQHTKFITAQGVQSIWRRVHRYLEPQCLAIVSLIFCNGLSHARWLQPEKRKMTHLILQDNK
eukprot:scaffold538148_cov18-Prasinocladus_malaysianus.AAC.2